MEFYLRHCFGFMLQIIPCIVLCYLPFKQPRLRLSGRITVMILTISGIMFSALFPLTQGSKSIDMFGYNNMVANIYMSVVIVLVIAFYLYNVTEIMIKKIMVIILVVFYASTQYMFVNILTPFLSKKDQFEVYSPAYFTLFCITTAALFPMAVYIMRHSVYRYVKEIDVHNMKCQFRWIANVSAFSIVLVIIYSSIPEDSIEEKWAVIGPLFILVTVILIHLYYTFFEESVTRKHEDEQRRLLEISRVQYQNITNEIEKTRRMRHDMRHHLRNIYDMAGNNLNEEIKTYISELMKISDNHIMKNFCENQTINRLLQYYIADIEDDSVEYFINVKCRDVDIEDTDITVVIGNILENAICSCERYRIDQQSDGKPKLYVDIGVVGSALMIQVKNNCPRVQPSGKYRINDEFVPAAAFISLNKNGGMGLKSIENIADKYDGEAVFKYDEMQKMFITRVRLNFHPEVL